MSFIIVLPTWTFLSLPRIPVLTNLPKLSLPNPPRTLVAMEETRGHLLLKTPFFKVSVSLLTLAWSPLPLVISRTAPRSTVCNPGMKCPLNRLFVVYPLQRSPHRVLVPLLMEIDRQSLLVKRIRVPLVLLAPRKVLIVVPYLPRSAPRKGRTLMCYSLTCLDSVVRKVLVTLLQLMAPANPVKSQMSSLKNLCL